MLGHPTQEPPFKTIYKQIDFYLVDVITRCTVNDFVENNCKETTVSKAIQLWLSIFGAADTFLMDNGGESANDEMWGLGNKYGINIKQTAAYSPWANALNERNHATIDIMIKKYLTIFLMLMKIQLFSMLHLLGIVTFMFLDSHLLS